MPTQLRLPRLRCLKKRRQSKSAAAPDQGIFVILRVVLQQSRCQAFVDSV